MAKASELVPADLGARKADVGWVVEALPQVWSSGREGVWYKEGKVPGAHKNDDVLGTSTVCGIGNSCSGGPDRGDVTGGDDEFVAIC
jgi:hypothetical protein